MSTGEEGRAPVILGVGQISAKGEEDVSPGGLMAEAARRALADSGVGEALLGRIDSLAVPSTFSWPLEDPARVVAAELGVDPQETVRSATGGTAPLMLLADACERISNGEIEASMITGGEAVNPFMRAMAEGRETGWPGEEPGTEPTRMLPGEGAEAGHPAELAASLVAPLSYYPLFEHAIRAEAGTTSEQHQRRLGELWARVGSPARDNPHAWTREVPDADGIAIPGERNRLAMNPYTKLMTANIQVDQGAAVVLCSRAAAEELGVPPERRIYVSGLAHANDHWFVGERDRLDRSPAIRINGERALAHAGVGIGEVDHFDLYSCFPSAVQIAARELGIDLDSDPRSLSQTGGLTFAGGPANNYCAHSLAAMVQRLRSEPGTGLVTAVGWYMTKHALAVLSSEAPEGRFARFDNQEAVDVLPRRTIASDPEGIAPVETFTVAYERDGTPSVAIVSCVLEDGSRAFAKSGEAAAIARLLQEEPIGLRVQLRGSEFSFGTAG